jgi:hypothetical protein
MEDEDMEAQNNAKIVLNGNEYRSIDHSNHRN